MQEFPSHWDLITKINYLQRKILLNSIAYYEYDASTIDDHFYDSICRRLVILHGIYDEETGRDFSRDSEYGYVFYDFTGDTGYHLYSRLEPNDRYWLDMMVHCHINQPTINGMKGRDICLR